MGDEMLKVSLFGVTTVMLSAVISCNVIAKTEFRTLSFQGEIAEPSCYSDLSTISCYDQNFNQFLTQVIQPKILPNAMYSGEKRVLLTQFKKINNLVFSRKNENEVILVLHYN